MFASVLPTSMTSSKYGAKTPTKFSVRVFKAPALPIPPATLNAKMDLGYRAPTEQQAQTWYPSRSQPPKAPHFRPNLNVNVGYDSSRPRSITQYSIYPVVANPTTFIYEQSTCSKSDTVSSSECDSTTMSYSPATSIDSTMALKSPGDPELFERGLEERIPTPAPRRDSFSLRDRNYPSGPAQNPHYAPSESDADELDRIAQLNAQYNAASTGSYYANSNDASRDEDVRLASALQVLDIRGTQGSQTRTAIPQPTYSNHFVNHSPEEMHPSLGVQYAGSGAPAPSSFFPDSDVDRRVSQEPLYQHSNSSSSTEAPLPSPQTWDSDSTQNRDRSPTLQRQTGAPVPSPTYQHAGYQHPVSRPAGSRDYPSPDSNNSRHSDRRQTADDLPPSAQPAPLARQRSLFADHRNSVAGPWSDTNNSQPSYEARDRVEFPQVSESRRHEEYRRDVRYESSPTAPSPAESGSRMYPQPASESRRHEEPAIRQYEEPLTRRSTDQGRANSGHPHRDSAFLRERVLSASYNGAPQNRSPPRRSSGESRRDSHTAANDVPGGQPSTSRRKDPRPLDLVRASSTSPTSQSPTARRRSSVVFAAAAPRSESSPTDMHAISGNERSGDRQRTRTNSISHQRSVDLQSPTSLPPSPDRPDPSAHHDQNRRPRHPDVAGVRDSVYFNQHEPPREPEARSRHSSRLSFSYPPPSPSQPTSTRSQPDSAHVNMSSHTDPHVPRGRTPLPVPRVSAPEPHRRLSDGDRPSTDTPVYPRSATPHERSSGSSRNTVITVPSAYHHTSRAHGEHPRRFSDGDQSIRPRLLSSGRNSAPLGRSVRWTDELICPSPITASQRRKGWFNRRGDQLWTNDGQYKPANQGEEYPPHLDDYPEPGQGWMNEEGIRIDLGHRLIPKAPLRSALKQTRG